jgi:threonine dehydrogenase-like Zn-dependent dehydrogenase
MHVPAFVGDQKIEWVDKAVPRPGPQQLLLAVEANALCGTDRLQYRYGSPIATPGHEAAGVVVAAGDDTRTAVGTRGAVFLMDFCGTCRSCLLGHTNQCLAKRGDMGFDRDGGYGPFELVHESVFFAVDDDISGVEATLLLDVMGTSSHAIGRAQQMRADIETVLVAGAGPIGLGVVAMARLMLGLDVPVHIFDLAPYRLGLAEDLGAVGINIADRTLAEAMAEMGLDSFDVAFDATGKSVARRACVDALGKRGALACIGHGQTLELRVSDDLIAAERAVLGSEYFRFNEMPANLERLRANREYLNRIITHRFDVAQIAEAFETFLGGETGKVVITHG